MSDMIYKWYSETRNRIEKVKIKNPDCLISQRLVQDWQEAVDTIEQSNPDMKSMYERRKLIMDSLTYEQKDHICYMIGDWYCEWQGKMWVNDKPNQHWLGVAKEQLKSMICGD